MSDCIAFEGNRRIGRGELIQVARKVKRVLDRGERGPVLLFDTVTSRPVEVDFRGGVEEVVKRLEAKTPESVDVDEPKGKGRPRLGVVAREITLLPRHWDWLGTQPGGASATIRRLVEEARKVSAPQDRKREAQESAYRFMTAMGGNQPGYEEALRALYAGRSGDFGRAIQGWPKDVREQTRVLGRRAMIKLDNNYGLDG